MTERCECCGRLMSELTPFGGPGDLFPGDFTGVRLVRRWRPRGPYSEEAQKAMDEYETEYPEIRPDRLRAEEFVDIQYEERKDLLEWFITKFGWGTGRKLCWTACAQALKVPSWECRDCIILDDYEYFKKLESTFRFGRIPRPIFEALR